MQAQLLIDDVSVRGNRALNVGQARAWYRRKTKFIAFGLLSTIVALSVLVSIPLYHQKPTTNSLASLVNFTCSSSSNQTFIVDVEVNLTDGMNQDEAISVVAKAYEGARGYSVRLATRSISGAYIGENGFWTVEFHITYTRRKYYFGSCFGISVLHEHFYATVNPIHHTVLYSFTASSV